MNGKCLGPRDLPFWRKTKTQSKTRRATPPTTPPVMSPTGVLWELLEEDGCVGLIGVVGESVVAGRT